MTSAADDDDAATGPAEAAPPPPESPSSCPPILRGIRSALGPDLLASILNSRILLVGSGGIGCELLKNLALSGFRDVEVIDLDTIDVSNLNRQFLFRSHHVGMPKCAVASEAASRMAPPLGEGGAKGREKRYLPRHGNVCDNAQFNVPYVRQFALVLNALDNVAARRRVNRLCLAAAVPLVEAGTAGYLGQVTVIDKPSGTECYECQAKPTQKVYPICTIRSTPSQPVHCIVWAKELYKLCFGPKVEDSMLFEDEQSLRADMEASEKEKQEAGGDEGTEGGVGGTSGSEKAEAADDGFGDDGAGGGGEKSTYMDVVKELRSLLGVESASDKPPPGDEGALRSKAREVLTALFVAEIQKQIGMDRYKTAEKVPVPVSSDALAACGADDPAPPPTAREGYAPTDVWGPADCVSELAACFAEVAANASAPDPAQPLPAFDKDDDVAMRFVTAASNLRSCVFSIEPLQSLYDAKGIAGNIIPAIATTNAIVAGLQVLQSFHILRAQLEAGDGAEPKSDGAGAGKLKEVCRYIYCLRDKTRKGHLLQPTTLPDPNPNCFVCRNATISLSLNVEEWTLEMLLHRVIKKELGFAQPSIMIGEDSIVYEEGDDIDPSEYSANLPKRLVDLPAGGVGHGSSIRVEDFTQDLEVDMSVSHKDRWVIFEGENGKKGEPKEDDREEIEKFEIGGQKPIVTPAPARDDSSKDAYAGSGAKAGDDSDDEEIEVISADDVQDGEDAKIPAKDRGESQPLMMKRPLEEESVGNNRTAKKAKLDGANEKGDGLEVIELD